MRVYLIRHGETDHNAARRIQGPLLDDPLNARGRVQAEALARHFAKERATGLRFDAVYSSPLKRAWETAEAVARIMLPDAPDARRVLPMAEMIEFSWGIYLGRKEDEVLAQMHAVHDEWAKGNVQHAPPEGESPESAWRRARPGWERLLAAHPRGTVALVAHGRINKIVLAALHAQDLTKMDTYGQGNTSITLLEKPPGEPFDAPWRLHFVNHKDHLAGLVEALPGTQAEGEPPLV